VIVSRESFDSADESTKLLLLYDILSDQHKVLLESADEQKITCNKQCEAYNKRIKSIENSKLINSGLAAAGGIVGGITAVVLNIKFFN